MNHSVDRRAFLRTTALATSGLLASSLFAQTLPVAPVPAVTATPAKKPAPKPPALPPEKVSAVVGQAHRSLAGVRALVEEMPLLVNACWDHGGGDFETPLQAAAHTGQREIALYLLSKQARLDVFAAAMLGQLDFIKAAFALDPKVHEIPGPHGFTLLHCALNGDEQAAHVVAWLRAQGVSEDTKRPLPVFWPAGTAPTAG